MRSLKMAVVVMTALAVLASLFAVAGCASQGGGSGGVVDDSKLLQGHAWKATKIAGIASVVTEKGAEATAEFTADGKLTGSGGVNRFATTYKTTTGNKIEIGQAAATMMAGPPAAMQQEQAYFAALPQAQSFKVTADTLQLLGAQGEVLVEYEALTPVSLTGTEWTATAYNNGKGALQSLAASTTITAKFAEDGSMSGNATINNYTAKYTAPSVGQMTIADVASTKMAGPEEFMAQETAYLAALPKTATYTIEGDELWLRDSTGAAMAHYVAK